MARWRDWEQFAQSRPIQAKGGIRAQAQRGQFGESWWAKRWIAALEGFNLGGRLQRGRAYARKGQVLSIAIESGTVEAKVQGSRPQPYHVQIKVKLLSAQEWQKVADVASRQAIYGAKLLAGEMPQDIEAAFETAGLSLFPKRSFDLQTHCSCPDSSNPCKHIAAVYYLLGEEFDRDPFLIFQLRGMGRDEFLRMLGEPAAEESQYETPLPPEPLPVSAVEFWNAPPLPEHPVGEVQALNTKALLPRRLGKFPFWRGQQSVAQALDPVYGEAARRASKIIGG